MKSHRTSNTAQAQGRRPQDWPPPRKNQNRRQSRSRTGSCPQGISRKNDRGCCRMGEETVLRANLFSPFCALHSKYICTQCRPWREFENPHWNIFFIKRWFRTPRFPPGMQCQIHKTTCLTCTSFCKLADFVTASINFYAFGLVTCKAGLWIVEILRIWRALAIDAVFARQNGCRATRVQCYIFGLNLWVSQVQCNLIAHPRTLRLRSC